MSGEGNVLLVILAAILVVILLNSTTAVAGLMLLATFLSWVVVPAIMLVAFLIYFMGP